MSKQIFFFIYFITGISTTAISQDTFTIFLVRHAEKVVLQEHSKDPALTACGQKRAESLAMFLSEVNIDAVYSTDFTRTKSTAIPTAKLMSQDIDIYNPYALDSLAQILLEKGQNALVVGHSNTTGVLAGLLVQEEIPSTSMNEDTYDRIYQVVISRDSKQLHVFHSAFRCDP